MTYDFTSLMDRRGKDAIAVDANDFDADSNINPTPKGNKTDE